MVSGDLLELDDELADDPAGHPADEGHDDPTTGAPAGMAPEM